MALTYIQKTVHPTPITLHESNGVAYFTFPLLEQTRMVRHAFSTRLGGASKGYFSTMNFSLTRGDNRDDVLENYRKMARILGTDVSKMVLSHQTHTTNIRLVTEADAGKGIWRERDYENIDGLITNVPGLTLVTFFADCVPLYFVDPEVSEDVADAFKEEFGAEISQDDSTSCYSWNGKSILMNKGNGKYQLDLWGANRLVLLDAGILPEHLAVTNVCTKCNPELLYSHRVMGDKRGNLAAFLSLK